MWCQTGPVNFSVFPSGECEYGGWPVQLLWDSRALLCPIYICIPLCSTGSDEIAFLTSQHFARFDLRPVAKIKISHLHVNAKDYFLKHWKKKPHRSATIAFCFHFLVAFLGQPCGKQSRSPNNVLKCLLFIAKSHLIQRYVVMTYTNIAMGLWRKISIYLPSSVINFSRQAFSY